MNLVYIVLDYIDGEPLFSYCTNLGRIDEEAARFFFKQLIDTMEYMICQNVVHRDLKLENILVDSQTL